ncbi:hypothetical protein Tco_0205871 [Tanacetum coccineum]
MEILGWTCLGVGDCNVYGYVVRRRRVDVTWETERVGLDGFEGRMLSSLRDSSNYMTVMGNINGGVMWYKELHYNYYKETNGWKGEKDLLGVITSGALYLLGVNVGEGDVVVFVGGRGLLLGGTDCDALKVDGVLRGMDGGGVGAMGDITGVDRVDSLLVGGEGHRVGLVF